MNRIKTIPLTMCLFVAFPITTFLIFEANRREFAVSCRLSDSDLKHANKTVFVSASMAFCKTCVRLEFRYGTFREKFTRASTTSARVEIDLFVNFQSFSFQSGANMLSTPVAFDLLERLGVTFDAARSTN